MQARRPWCQSAVDGASSWESSLLGIHHVWIREGSLSRSPNPESLHRFRAALPRAQPLLVLVRTLPCRPSRRESSTPYIHKKPSAPHVTTHFSVPAAVLCSLVVPERSECASTRPYLSLCIARSRARLGSYIVRGLPSFFQFSVVRASTLTHCCFS